MENNRANTSEVSRSDIIS